MKGTDVTEAEIEHARQFLKLTGNYSATQRAGIDRDQMAQLLAWYSALRGGNRTPGIWTCRGEDHAEVIPDALDRPDSADAQTQGVGDTAGESLPTAEIPTALYLSAKDQEHLCNQILKAEAGIPTTPGTEQPKP